MRSWLKTWAIFRVGLESLGLGKDFRRLSSGLPRWEPTAPRGNMINLWPSLGSVEPDFESMTNSDHEVPRGTPKNIRSTPADCSALFRILGTESTATHLACGDPKRTGALRCLTGSRYDPSNVEAFRMRTPYHSPVALQQGCYTIPIYSPLKEF